MLPDSPPLGKFAFMLSYLVGVVLNYRMQQMGIWINFGHAVKLFNRISPKACSLSIIISVAGSLAAFVPLSPFLLTRTSQSSLHSHQSPSNPLEIPQIRVPIVSARQGGNGPNQWSRAQDFWICNGVIFKFEAANTANSYSYFLCRNAEVLFTLSQDVTGVREIVTG